MTAPLHPTIIAALICGGVVFLAIGLMVVIAAFHRFASMRDRYQSSGDLGDESQEVLS